MFGVRIHGRGGQGVATTANLLSAAAFHGGRYAQAFAAVRRARPGVPVAASCRIDDMPIRGREPVSRPDALIVADVTLLAGGRQATAVLAGLPPEGYLLVNSPVGLGELGLGDRIRHLCRDRVLVVPASGMALDHLGRPLPGAALLGGLAALTGVVSLAHLTAALQERFPRPVAEGNAACGRAGYGFVRAEREALTGAQVD